MFAAVIISTLLTKYVGNLGNRQFDHMHVMQVLVHAPYSKQDKYHILGHYNEITCFSSAPHRIACVGGQVSSLSHYYFYTSINSGNLVYIAMHLAHDYIQFIGQAKVPHSGC